MTRLMMFVLSVLFVLPTLSQAQSVTWHLLDFRDPDAPGRMVNLIGVAQDRNFLGNTRRLAFRIDPAGTLSAIRCPLLPRDPTTGRSGPQGTGFNEALTFAGTDAILVGGVSVSAGIVQTVDGACRLVRHPEALNTFLFAIASDGSTAGTYHNPQLGPDKRQFVGFEEADGVFQTLSGLCPSESLWPESKAGDTLVGYAFCNITPGADDQYDAWARVSGTYQILRAPGDKKLWCPAVNAQNQAYCVEANAAQVTGGKAWKADLNVTPPAYSALPLPPPQDGGTVTTCTPRATNALGWWVCTGNEVLPNCPPPNAQFAVNCNVTRQWLAVPDEPPEPPTKEKQPKRDRPEKEQRDKPEREKSKDRR
jgi:hypothetical protein